MLLDLGRSIKNQSWSGPSRDPLIQEGYLSSSYLFQRQTLSLHNVTRPCVLSLHTVPKRSMATLLNKLSPFPAFGYGSAFSSTSRLGLRPTWKVSSLKSTQSGWRFYHHDSAQISSNKPMVKSASDAALISHRLRNTQGERILWVDLAYKIEYGVGEVVYFSPEVASTTEGRQEGKSGRC